MRTELYRSALIVFSLNYLIACGSPHKKAGETGSELESVDTKGSEKFNLAKFVRENPKTEILKKLVGDGDSFLFFGDKTKFRIETNMTLDTQGEKGFFFGGPRAIAAAYWLDGYVFNKKIGGSSDRGYLIDLGAIGDLETTSLEAHVRFLGQDKYRGKVEGHYEKTFMRDLSIEPVYYPMPLLGVKLSGNIGGELGLSADLGVKTANVMSLVFRPEVKLNGGLSGGVEVLKFVSAKVQGLVSMIDLNLAGTADLGFLKEANYSYGHTGVDVGELKAMDGLLEVFAKAQLKGVLPGGVDAALWKIARETVGLEKEEYEWQHTIWDPKPVVQKDLSSYGNSFMKFAKMPSGLADCHEKAALISETLDKHAASLEAKNKSLQGIESTATAQSVDYLKEIKLKVSQYCRQF